MKQMIIYAFIGIVSTVIDLTFFTLFYDFFHIYYIYSVIIAFIIATLGNWYIGKKILFKSSHLQIKNEIIGIYLVSSVGCLIHVLVTWASVTLLLMTPFIGKLIAILIAFIWSFYSRKKFIYKT